MAALEHWGLFEKGCHSKERLERKSTRLWNDTVPDVEQPPTALNDNACQSHTWAGIVGITYVDRAFQSKRGNDLNLYPSNSQVDDGDG